ncbi:hypothetical protein D9756_004089 [Leucocoprinus leucothites]|uniref:Seipin n=1 Tax=Leucocoprinus leucothites TaxID=201217 RepID=A0A8H5G0N2_9AGAR|nr:hypothetical protein D9756_004089 [Leucoagaricus leucothites]
MSMKLEESNTYSLRKSSSESSRARNGPRGLLRGLGSSLLLAPLNLLNLVAVNGVSVLRPYAPQLIPILICLFLIPIAVCLSLFAGWRVWKSLSVGWEVPLYLQYGERIIPYAVAAIPPIQASQPYDISLRMRLPNLDSNLSLGNFMTTLTIMTPSNQTLASVSRPALVLPQTPSWIFGTPSSIDLDIALFTSFIAKTPNVLAYVEVGRRDGWKSIGDGRGREVSVLSATLCGKEIPRGIRGLAIRHPVIASALAACIFLLILSLMIGTCVLPTMFPIPVEDEVDSERQAKNTSKFTSEPPSLPSSSRARSHSTPLRRRRSKIARPPSGSSRAVVPKTEESTDEVPTALMPSSVTVTENTPEVSAHMAGPSGETAREKLRRRASHQLAESEEDLSSSEEQ